MHHALYDTHLGVLSPVALLEEGGDDQSIQDVSDGQEEWLL